MASTSRSTTSGTARMTADFWEQVLAEFKALGWRCVAYGPEFWLAFAALCGSSAIATVISWIVFSNWKDGR